MMLEQNLGDNGQEKIITNESVQEVIPTKVISEEDKQAKIKEKDQTEEENNKQIENVKQDILKKFENLESKEEYPEGHIMNSNMLDKIAQLEAISQDTFEFIQDRYDKYIEDELSGKHSGGSVTGNQEKIKELIKQGEDMEDALFEADVIYGEGGWNRYVVDADTGMVKLNSGKSATNTTGSKEYFDTLRSKAKELGMDI